jgi:hypothetical protein
MKKKIVWGIVLFGLVGILVAGAVVRTVAKAGDGGEALGAHSEPGRAAVGGGSLAAGTGRGGGLGDGTGTGQAEVDEWVTVQGTVVSVDADALVVQAATGEQVVVENRPWSFVQEQGFAAQPGDQMTLAGFYEDGDLEVGQITDTTNGQTVQLRDTDGRPMWAGRGRNNG